MSEVLDELSAVKPGPGSDKVYYPGERALIRKAKCDAAGGIEIVDDIYEYLTSDKLYIHSWDHKNRFAEKRFSSRTGFPLCPYSICLSFH